MEQASKKLKKRDHISIFMRSFFIQAGWNFKSLISIGFAYALIPVARRLYRDNEARAKFLLRHIGFFNAHPYFASYALGAIARLEEENAQNEDSDQTERIEKFKNALIGPLGAVGDQYFWATVKPAAVLLGMIGLLLAPQVWIKLTFLALLLILYNISHLMVRIRGQRLGYEKGYHIYKEIRIEKYGRSKRTYHIIGAILLGLLTGYLIGWSDSQHIIATLVFFGSMVLAYYVKTVRQSFYGSILIPLLFMVIAGLITSIAI